MLLGCTREGLITHLDDIFSSFQNSLHLDRPSPVLIPSGASEGNGLALLVYGKVQVVIIHPELLLEISRVHLCEANDSFGGSVDGDSDCDRRQKMLNLTNAIG